MLRSLDRHAPEMQDPVDSGGGCNGVLVGLELQVLLQGLCGKPAQRVKVTRHLQHMGKDEG